MDKAEYKIATEHIKKLISQGEYAEASHIADTIDWRRVKSVMMLCTVSDLYKVNRRYEDAKELLYMAYERNPESRTILYSLCDLSIKLEEFVAAIEYYKSFVEVAPKDTGRYVLQYRLYQAQDVGLEERIEVLEQLKREEYIEKWAYELAYLYHRIGFATKCVEECDELILWFGKGRYVYKAMELKMLHEPLTPSQQHAYDHRFEHLEQAKDMTRVLPRIDSGDSEMTDESMVDVTDAPTVEIPQEYLEQEIKGEVADIQVKTLDVANAYNTMNLQKELADSLREILEVSHTESSVDLSQTEDLTSSFEDTTEVADKVPSAESAIEVMEESDEPVVESLHEEAVPVEEVYAEEFPEEEPPEQMFEEELVEPIVVQEVTTSTVSREEEIVNEQITGQLSIEDVLAEWDKQQEDAAEAHKEEISNRIKNQTQDIFAAIEAEMQKDIFAVMEEAEETGLINEATEAIEQETPEVVEEVVEASLVDISTEELVEDLPEDAYEEEAAQDEIAEDAKESQEEVLPPDSVRDLSRYAAFIRSKDTEAQILDALQQVSGDTSHDNVCVTGHDLAICFEFIKTMMADLKNQGFSVKGKTAKISAVNLNKKEPSEIISKVDGGILIIERAGRLRKDTIEKMKACLQSDLSTILVFLTDTEQGMNRFTERYPSLSEMFNLRVDIKDYSADELVEQAIKYAYEQEYSIETMGRLALRTRIEEMIANDDAPDTDDVRDIIDEAIDHVSRKNFKHFMDILTHKRYDEEDMIVLREDDFMVN